MISAVWENKMVIYFYQKPQNIRITGALNKFFVLFWCSDELSCLNSSLCFFLVLDTILSILFNLRINLKKDLSILINMTENAHVFYVLYHIHKITPIIKNHKMLKEGIFRDKGFLKMIMIIRANLARGSTIFISLFCQNKSIYMLKTYNCF